MTSVCERVCKGEWERKMVWGAAAVFAGTVSALKVAQHASLQTQAYDLGLFSNILWNTAHGRFFLNSLRGTCHLGDHFSPILAFLAPVFWIWKNAAALLVIQSVALALGIPAVFELTRHATGRAIPALLFSFWYALFPYVHFVSRYDFHETALGVPILLWALAAWVAGRRKCFLGLVLAAVFLREDYPLLLAGLGASLWFRQPADAAHRRWGGALLLGGLVGTVVLTRWVMPIFNPAPQPLAFSYGHLGSSITEVVRSLLNPRIFWKYSFGSPERVAAMIALLMWTAFLPLAVPRLAPSWLVPLGLNVLSQGPWQYGFQLHYSATVLPFLFYAMAEGWKSLSAGWMGRWLHSAKTMSVMAMVAFFCAGRSLPSYFHPISAEKRRALAQILQRIPETDSVQAQTNLLPHVAFRAGLNLFPAARPTRWVLIDLNPVGFHPPEEFLASLRDFSKNNAARRVFAGEDLCLFRADAPR